MKSQQAPMQRRVCTVIKRKPVIEKKVRNNAKLGPKQSGERRAQEPEPNPHNLKNNGLNHNAEPAEKRHPHDAGVSEAPVEHVYRLHFHAIVRYFAPSRLY